MTSTASSPLPKQRIALITGANRGLGRSAALHLARAGVDVIITYLNGAAQAADAAAAQTMLEHLTDYLHSALPDLRAVSSTVGRELDLAQAYLSIMRIRMGERLRFAIDAPGAVRALPMPPAMLISLVVSSMRSSLLRLR